MKANYHTHTPRCLHASGTEEEYVLAAIEGGFSILGFSDHTPNHYPSGYVATMRMRDVELPDYVQKVRAAGKKYADRIRVLCGLECEYFPRHLPWILEQKEKHALDYLILGNHFDSTDEPGHMYFGDVRDHQNLRRYTEMTIRGLQTGVFLYLAHPDVVLSQYPQFDRYAADAARELCRAAKELNIPLEYNLLGRLYWGKPRFRGLGYPCPAFWEVAAQEGVSCIIGVDAHAPAHLLNTDLYAQSVQDLQELGLTRHVSLL